MGTSSRRKSRESRDTHHRNGDLFGKPKRARGHAVTSRPIAGIARGHSEHVERRKVGGADIPAGSAMSTSAPGGPWIHARTGPDGYRTSIDAGGHTLVADESVAGDPGAGPSPYELLLAAIGSCTAMTMRMYATRKQWPLDEVIVRLRTGRKHVEDCENCE